jgi:uncharacterized protein (TIGR02679 family)
VSDTFDTRLRRLLGGEHLAPLRGRLRRRFERAPLDNVVKHIRISRLSAEEHAVLAALTGRPQRLADSLTFEIDLVDTTLRRSGVAQSLRDALEQLDGPIVHLATAHHRMTTLWSDVVESRSHSGLIEMLQTSVGVGLLKRLASGRPEAAEALCRRVEAILRRLPAPGVPRSQLAASMLGDAHALDDGQATGTLVLAVLRRNAPSSRDDGEESPVESTREIWAAAGVLVNELARPALFLNLPIWETGRSGGAFGEPTYVSLRSLMRSPPAWDVADRDIRICENPNLLAIAADRWGSLCAPLACTDGMPAAAQRCLLTQLSKAGARLHYHGDFDWPGLRIANHVIREYGARPWRFGVADYRQAVRTAADPGHRLEGTAVEAMWDEALAPAMRELRRSIAEEALAASLLRDLGG